MHIKNFLSLHEVSLPFKPLTVLVGANGSGKSNILKTLLMLHRMMLREKLPDSSTIQSWTWAGDLQSQIDFKMEVESDDNRAIYHLVLQAERLIHTEELLVNDVKVISVQQGFGEIRDEDDKNPIVYSSDKLALKSAGDYGNKPVTHRLTNFIKNWAFFNFMPEVMRGINVNSDKPIQLDDEGTVLKHLLSVWHDNDYEKFELVSQSLADVTNLSLARIDDEEGKLGLLEGYEKPIPLDRASDGTLRLLAYYTLLNQSDLPSLIAIEEPERNFHPAALIRVASLIEELAQKTQVIVTTHSAQFLDAFDKDSLGDNLGVLLLQNHKGTSIIDFEEEQNRRDALNSWIKDFGIGSAIFDSELLEKSFCQV
jgi:predicted ATPase